MYSTPPNARLLIACPDARGVTAAVTGFITDHGCNLLDLDQHTDLEHQEFFLRAEFEPPSDHGQFAAAFEPLVERHAMQWRLAWPGEPKRIAVLASKHLHCLNDLLWRANDEPIALVISNHADAEHASRSASVPFHHLPIADGGKANQEEKVEQLLQDNAIELVVLARYMQILSPGFVDRWRERIINVHHSFLPAFPGGDPYQQAYDRGVKVIGATAHYVTPVLDDGPIIAQAVGDVSHHDTVADLRRRGRDLERRVLSDAVRAHLEDRILVTNNRTVVFR